MHEESEHRENAAGRSFGADDKTKRTPSKVCTHVQYRTRRIWTPRSRLPSARVRSTKRPQQAANEARGLAMDSITAAASGHLGLPLGCAEMGAILFGTESGLSYNPADPQWINRDRFILSAGHGSMFVYSWLHLSGYDISLEEVKNFRQHHSMTPGHPEFPSSEHNTPGIESTTGPLGQVREREGSKGSHRPRACVSSLALLHVSKCGCLRRFQSPRRRGER